MTIEYYTKIRDDIIRSEKLTPKERSVLFVLLSYEKNCAEIFIGQKRLAKESGMKRKSVIDAVKGLKKKGLLKTEIKVDRSSLHYKLTDKVVVPKLDNVVSKTDRGCPKMTQGVVSKPDTSIINKSINKLDIKKTTKKKPAGDNGKLPDWLDKDAWQEWTQHRKELKKTLTPLTTKKQLNMLSTNQPDHVAIINQSIEKGWTGLFKLKEEKLSLEEKQLKNLMEAYPDD
jgi:hypothetical protein